MYNMNFVKRINKTNALFVFHSESNKSNIEKNIVMPIIKKLEPQLLSKYPNRLVNESLLCLRYPERDANALSFARFFDSPTATAILHREFKGVFIIDVSGYKLVTSEIRTLIHYIFDNLNKDFKFIVLLNNTIETTFCEEMKTFESDECETMNLEVDISALKEFKKSLDKASYGKLKEQFINDSRLRTISYAYFTRVLNANVDNIDRAITELKHVNYSERRIGF